MGIASSRVRLYFIYVSCLTMGSPVLLYLIAAFWLNIRQYIRNRRNLMWQ
jgi:phage shock protein PspC (stress-responsive transcriptional regulator)